MYIVRLNHQPCGLFDYWCGAHTACCHSLMLDFGRSVFHLTDIFIFLSLTGPDCSLNVPSTDSYWILPNVKPFSPSVGRASHKAVMHGKFMWVMGGYSFNYSAFQMVLK